MLRPFLAITTIVISLAAFSGVPQAAAQDTQTLSRTIAITSDPPGATVWKKEGTTLTCMDTVTPGTVELKFHGTNDVQKIRLRKFGYSGVNLDVKPSDEKVNAALGGPAPDSFLVSDDAKPELKQLNDGLEKEFRKTIFADPEAFRCARFELVEINVIREGETKSFDLNVDIWLDGSFGGFAFRQASRASNEQDRKEKMGQIALDEGIAEILGRFHRVAVKFPELKAINVSGSYSTTKAYLDTETTSHVVIHYTYGSRYDSYQGRIVGTQDAKQVTVTGENTVVKDKDVTKTIAFAMPTAQIPDTLDKKAISDAVLAVGKISFTGSSGGKRPAEPTASLPAGPATGAAPKAEAARKALRTMLFFDVDLARADALLNDDHSLVGRTDEYGSTPLHEAANRGKKEAAELLLAHGADVNARTNDGSTPLHDAAMGGSKEVAELLLAHGADVNAKQPDGATPLMRAAQFGSRGVAEILLAHGADVNAKDSAGRTALHWAEYSKSSGMGENVVDLVREHGGHE
jgi:hypothetical protein